MAAGCAINAAAVRSDEMLDATGSYVYGRFVIKAVPSTMGEKGRPANRMSSPCPVLLGVGTTF